MVVREITKNLIVVNHTVPKLEMWRKLRTRTTPPTAVVTLPGPLPKCSTGHGLAWATSDRKNGGTGTKSSFMGFNEEMKLSTWAMQPFSFPVAMNDHSLVSLLVEQKNTCGISSVNSNATQSSTTVKQTERYFHFPSTWCFSVYHFPSTSCFYDFHFPSTSCFYNFLFQIVFSSIVCVGRVERFWERNGKKMVSVRWFYHPEEVKASAKRLSNLKYPVSGFYKVDFFSFSL